MKTQTKANSPAAETIARKIADDIYTLKDDDKLVLTGKQLRDWKEKILQEKSAQDLINEVGRWKQ